MNQPRVRSLGDYLKTAGLHVEPAAEAKTAAAVVPAPAKTAAPKTSQPDTAPAGGHKPRDKEQEAPASDTGESVADKVAPKEASVKVAPGQVAYDPSLIKTAAQKWCLDQGMLIPDAKVAESIYAGAVKTAEAQKVAEQQKVAAELAARGEVMYNGMMKKSAAVQIAEGEMDLAGALKVAAYIGCDVNELIQAARQLKQAADGSAAAVGNDIFFQGALGTAARTESSRTQQAAETNKATTEYHVEAEAGTRPEQNGPNEKDMRFVDTVTMPGNPGLNHGQSVDQGKGL